MAGSRVKGKNQEQTFSEESVRVKTRSAMYQVNLGDVPSVLKSFRSNW